MENTVLILGAGFSKPYGYPTGPKLVKDIIRDCKGSHYSGDAKLAEELEGYGSYSIDKFLHENDRHYKSGVRKIIRAIAQAEIESLVEDVRDEDDIIKLILDEIDEDNFSKLRIISFNYDRLLEYKFLSKLMIKYRDKNKANEVFSRIKIKHVHGRMPPLREMEILKDSKDFNYKYALADASEDHASYVTDMLEGSFADEFKTIYKNTEEPDIDAVAAIKWAKRVFFLGFAYDDLNMKKLGLESPDITYDWKSKFLAGTSFQMPFVKESRVENRYPFLRKRLVPVSCRDFFAEHFDLTDSKNDVVKQTVIDRPCCDTHAIQERPLNEFTRFSHNHICHTCDTLFMATYSQADSNSDWDIRLSPRPQWEKQYVTRDQLLAMANNTPCKTES
jgi:hypothetical protein